MPTIDSDRAAHPAAGFGPSSWADPPRYPGRRPSFDYLLLGTRILPIEPASAGWRVREDRCALATLLTVPLSQRLPVVAFGSNADPAQLTAKFGAAAAIPVTRARLSGFAVGHSAHVSAPGYVPWVLVDEPGSVVDCAVLWLDDRQRSLLDVTEPNYDLVPVDASRHPLIVEAIDAVVGYAAYRGRWGALRWPGDDRPAPATGQAELFRRLRALAWFRDLVGVAAGELTTCQRRLAADPVLRDRVRVELSERGMALADGWAG